MVCNSCFLSFPFFPFFALNSLLLLEGFALAAGAEWRRPLATDGVKRVVFLSIKSRKNKYPN